MGYIGKRLALRARFLVLVALVTLLSACGNTVENVTLGVVGATFAGGYTPTNEIEQVYYLGAFDPQDQLPPTVYRVRVHGQSSFISQTHFASGWLPAPIVDSLGSNIGFDKTTGQLGIGGPAENQTSNLVTGRRLILFGPEGFREAPRDHRLVIVMGSSPEKFFSAIDQALGQVSQAQQDQLDTALNRKLYDALVRTRNERDRLSALGVDVDADLKQPATTGGS